MPNPYDRYVIFKPIPKHPFCSLGEGGTAALALHRPLGASDLFRTKLLLGGRCDNVALATGQDWVNLGDRSLDLAF